MAQGSTSDEGFWPKQDEVRAAVRRVLADAHGAEDVAQEALLRALQHEAGIEPERAGAWLTVVGRRLAIDELRTRQRLEVRADPDNGPVDGGDPADVTEQRALLAEVTRAMAALNPRQRRLLARQVAFGLSLAELAREEHTSVASVRSVLARAREALRDNLHQSGWLVGGLLPKLLSGTKDSADRLLARVERAVPLLPQARHETADALTALAAALAILFGSSSGVLPPAEAPAPVIARPGPSSPADAEARVRVEETIEARRRSIDSLAPLTPPRLLPSDAPGPQQGARAGTTVVPFRDLGGEVNQFAVAPDERTVLASGGWEETPASARGDTAEPQWEPVVHRSDDGGQTWRRVRIPGFEPGRILFAPDWPDDQRIVLVTRGVVRSSRDGGRTFRTIQDWVRVDQDHIGELQKAREDPTTVVRSGRERPGVDPLPPAVLSPRFSEGDGRVYVGNPAEVVDTESGREEPLVAVPPWVDDYGIALAPDHVQSGAVLVGATTRMDDPSVERGAVFRCREKQCERMHVFEDMTTPPALFRSATNPNLVYAWTTYNTHRSDDGGRTWTSQEVGPGVEVVEAGRRLVFHLMTGVSVSDDHGAVWRSLRLPFAISAVAAMGRQTVLLASGSGIACSPDAGNHWQETCPAI